MRKLAYEEVKEYIEGEEGNGCKLLTVKNNYKNVRTNLKIQCKCKEEIFEITFDSFKSKNKRQCNKCARKISSEKQKILYADIKSFIELESQSGCKLKTSKEEYINTHEKLLIKCKCGEEFTASFTKFKSDNQQQCEKCTGIIRWNIDKVKKYIENNSSCKLISEEYHDLNTPLKLLCECGKEFDLTFNQFYHFNIHKCQICNVLDDRIHKTNWSIDLIKDYLQVINSDYIVMNLDRRQIYNTLRLFTLIKCPNPLHKPYWVDWNSFLQGCRCRQCASENLSIKLKKEAEIFNKEVENLTNGEYQVVGEYIDARTRIKLKHLLCNTEYEVIPNNFLSGNRCSNCFKIKKLTNEEFVQRVFTLVEDEYTFLESYVNIGTKIKVRHNICGHEYPVTPGNFLFGRRCPECNESKGERSISDWLKKYNIIFISQYKISKCRNKRVMPFDFAIFDKNNNLIMIIEYDGEYHYLPIVNEKQLKKQQLNDDIKNNYCQENNIYLLRIPYWDFSHIEKILCKEVLNFG